jgi:hypothetical protein
MSQDKTRQDMGTLMYISIFDIYQATAFVPKYGTMQDDASTIRIRRVESQRWAWRAAGTAPVPGTGCTRWHWSAAGWRWDNWLHRCAVQRADAR